MPYRRIEDAAKLRRLLEAVLLIESDVELPALLHRIVEEACSLVDARYGALGVLNEWRTSLEQFVTVGLSKEKEERIGARPTGRGVLGLLISEPETVRLMDISSHPASYGFPPNHPQMKSFLGVPVKTRNDVFGNLYLTDKVGAAEFTDEDVALAEALALAAGIAIENYRLYDRLRQISVLDDRDRIARDLHDRVIQRVFAVGLSLQEATRLSDLDAIVNHVNTSIDDLDITITDIRSAIYELGGNSLPGGLRQGVIELIDELTPMLGSRPDVTFRGTVDNTVPQSTADNVLAVLREGLTNAGKYANATRYLVSLTVTDHVTLEVVDNGVGLDPETDKENGLGLGNMKGRAEKLNGIFVISPGDFGGTRLTWRVPLER
ncbi:MAG: GAF domain-containing protein [Acidimicrobiales bacterium]